MLGDKEENATQAERNFACAVTIGTVFNFPESPEKAGRLHHLLDKPF